MSPAPIHGRLTRSPEGKLEGWCYCANDLTTRRVVDLFLDDDPLISVVAAKFRADLFDRGIGDGYYGFAVSEPHVEPGRVTPRLLEARDRESGILFGRIVIEEGHGETDAARTRLAAIAATLERLPSLGDHEFAPTPDPFKQGLEAVGLGLRARLTPSQFGGATLAGLRSRQLRPRRLPWSAAPRITLALYRPRSLEATLTQIDELRPLVVSAPTELVVIDDAADPSLAYLPSLVEGIRLLREPGSTMGKALNTAAWHARGEILMFLDGDTRLEPAWALTAIDKATDSVQIGHPPAPTVIDGGRRGRVSRYPALCVRREQFESLGGLEVLPDRAANPWDEFVQKCRMVGHPVQFAPR